MDTRPTTLINAKTDDGRDTCLFLIDIMEGRIEDKIPDTAC